MNRRWKLALGAAAAVVLLVAVGASGAIAVSRALDDDTSQAIIDDAAQELGVEPEALSGALRQALENRIDEWVEKGRLTEEQGERLKEQLEAGEVPFFGRLGFPGKGHGRALGHVKRLASLDAAASYLELDEAELRERLRDGETLADVARDEGKSVDGLVDELLRAGEEQIDEAVEAGHLDEDRAEELKEALESRVTELVHGELGLRGGPWLDRGFGLRGSPPPFAGPRG